MIRHVGKSDPHVVVDDAVNAIRIRLGFREHLLKLLFHVFSVLVSLVEDEGVQVVSSLISVNSIVVSKFKDE